MGCREGAPGVSHRRLVVPRRRKLVALALLASARTSAPRGGRAAAADGGVLPERGGGGGTGDAAEKSLWGAHKVAVLLPDGKEAVRIMQDFKNQRTTLLLCTPEVERGLDMPGIDHVYSLDAPGSTAQATSTAPGRCGRVGASSSGCVTAVVSPEEEAALEQCMLDLELRDWEALEEETNAPPPMTMVGEATIAAEGEEDVPSTFSTTGADEAAREEERQLTAAEPQRSVLPRGCAGGRGESARGNLRGG